MDHVRSPDLDVSDEKSLQTTEASPHQDEPSDSGTKKVWSSKSVHNTEHTQRGTETREGGGRGRGTYTVYLGNLAYECDTQDIEEFFEKRSVKVPLCVVCVCVCVWGVCVWGVCVCVCVCGVCVWGVCVVCVCGVCVYVCLCMCLLCVHILCPSIKGH